MIRNKMIFLILLLVSISGCTNTTELVYIEPKPFELKKTVPPKTRSIRVHMEDSNLYRAYIDKLRSQINFHNEQIDNYLNSFQTADGTQ